MSQLPLAINGNNNVGLYLVHMDKLAILQHNGRPPKASSLECLQVRVLQHRALGLVVSSASKRAMELIAIAWI